MMPRPWLARNVFARVQQQEKTMYSGAGSQQQQWTSETSLRGYGVELETTQQGHQRLQFFDPLLQLRGGLEVDGLFGFLVLEH
jgi:hypothetical protein